MFCRHCGHQNPEQNKFCGMCGNKLAAAPPPEVARAADPKPVVEKAAINLERTAPLAAHHVAKLADSVNLTPKPPQPKPTVAEAQPAQSSDKWWVDEGPSETTGGGLSILGLNTSGSGKAGGYSYLLEEEDQPSRAAVWVLLLVLLVLGGVLYARWQPIRDYVLTTALAHSQPQPAPETKNEPPASPAAPAPTAAPAAGDASSQPAVASESKPEPTAQADPQSSAAGKPDDNSKATPAGANSERLADVASAPPSAKLTAAKKKAAADQADDENASTAGEEKPSAAQKAKAFQANPGSELVSSGERYLYARGVARNCRQAVSYFNAAAAQQNPQAFSHLGALYATGECVPLDRAVAYAWFARAYAREPGNRYFEQNLTMLWREMTPSERQRATRQ